MTENTPTGSSASDLAAARERLRAWVDDAGSYAGWSGAARDIRTLIDALAVAVKGCGKIMGATQCGAPSRYGPPDPVLCYECDRKLHAAITALLDGRTTTNE